MRASQAVQQIALLALQIVIVAALLTFILLFAERYNRRFDLSPTQEFVLSQAAQQVAETLTVPLRITAFYNTQEAGQRREMMDKLELFARASKNITFRVLDLDRSPALAQKYGISNANAGVLEQSDSKLVTLRVIDEEEITNAIIKLTRHATRTLCFVSGHGEHTPYDNNDRSGYSEVGKALEGENFEIQKLDNIPPAGIPAKCTTLVLAGPRHDFQPGETEQLDHYLDGGGQVLFLLDPGAPKSAVEFLRAHGLRAGDDVVMDERNRLMGTDSAMLSVPAFNKQVFRADFDAAVFPVTRTILPTEEADESGHVTILALSSPDSWAHVNGGKLPDGEVRFRREVDHPGPLPVGAMLIVPPHDATDTTSRPGRMIVFGDSDFATNLSLNWRGNKDLFMSSVALLAEDSALIAIRRKGVPRGSISPIFLTEAQDSVVFWVGVIAVPLTFALVGIVLTVRRRRKASR